MFDLVVGACTCDASIYLARSSRWKDIKFNFDILRRMHTTVLYDTCCVGSLAVTSLQIRISCPSDRIVCLEGRIGGQTLPQ